MRGPKAPKDPVAKRPAVYVMVDAVIDGSPRGNGKFQDICYLNGRIVQKISVICDTMPKDVLELVRDCFRFIADFEGQIPGASAKDCGNYLDMNLPMAKYWGARYTALLENIDDTQLIYPE